MRLTIQTGERGREANLPLGVAIAAPCMYYIISVGQNQEPKNILISIVMMPPPTAVKIHVI
jgi:hypothetical protein